MPCRFSNVIHECTRHQFLSILINRYSSIIYCINLLMSISFYLSFDAAAGMWVGVSENKVCSFCHDIYSIVAFIFCRLQLFSLFKFCKPRAARALHIPHSSSVQKTKTDMGKSSSNIFSIYRYRWMNSIFFYVFQWLFMLDSIIHFWFDSVSFPLSCIGKITKSEKVWKFLFHKWKKEKNGESNGCVDSQILARLHTLVCEWKWITQKKIDIKSASRKVS